MNHEHEKEAAHNEAEEYGDPSIASFDNPVPGWLIFNYIFWPIVGLFVFYFFWNGSYGWLDRGYWQQLQRAANTTYPFHTDVDNEPTENPRTKNSG